MGASLYLRFPGGESGDHPGLPGDDTRYAHWIESVLANASVSACVRDAGHEPLLFTFPAFEPDKKMRWVAPEKLRQAALGLREEVLGRSELGSLLSGLYRTTAGDEPAHQLLAEDLQGIAEIAEYAESEDLEQVALTIGW